MKRADRLVIITLDGSKNSLVAIDYLLSVFGSLEWMEVHLLHLLPQVPPVLKDSPIDGDTALKIKNLKAVNLRIAKSILEEGRSRLVENGFDETKIHLHTDEPLYDISKEICLFAEKRRADAVLMSTRGRSFIERLMLGETASKVLEFSRIVPVWLVKNDVKQKNVMIALDGSKSSMRAVDFAGFIFSGSDVKITLFHSIKSIRRYFSKKAIQKIPDIEDTYINETEKGLLRSFDEAKTVLMDHGIQEERIGRLLIKGSRNTAGDIIRSAAEEGCGTIIVGRWGEDREEEYGIGNTPRKLLAAYDNMALCIVP